MCVHLCIVVASHIIWDIIEVVLPAGHKFLLVIWTLEKSGKLFGCRKREVNCAVLFTSQLERKRSTTSALRFITKIWSIGRSLPTSLGFLSHVKLHTR